MITDIASTSQCRSMPSRYCHTSTDSPNEAPSDSATVPTITAAATRLRVMMSMMMKIRHSDATPAISRSTLDPSRWSLLMAAVPVR
ncbi:hypothetical protein C1Y40_05069 [Mycobacterium talmoniae]|uniref:Uncharacterized protein n=1 Tax=Mycobacterium talmoniae TaxID=1858794 RepID=A0A2S8BDR7_9MYCO|nr:hypothetical protein C1Y40_05069 [Mycobacterium talmoniae]